MNTGLQSEQPYLRGPEDRTVDPANTKAKRHRGIYFSIRRKTLGRHKRDFFQSATE